MSTVTVIIPDDLDEQLDNLKVKKEDFLLNALKEKIDAQKTYDLQSSLIEGYKSSHVENKELTSEFIHADLENWYDY